MRTVNFRDNVIWPVVSRMGYDPTFDLSPDFADALARYVNAWVPKCWEAADWPEFTRIESRIPVNHLVPYDVAVYQPPNWTIAGNYNLDTVVTDPAAPTDVYVSTQNANTGHALSDTSWWTKISNWNPDNNYATNDRVTDPASGIVYVAQANIKPGTAISDSLQNPKAWAPIYTQQQAVEQITNIGKPLKVYPVDPRISDGPFDIPFTLEDTAIHVGFDHGTKVWIKFLSRPSRYTLTKWDATATYTGGTTDTAPIVYDLSVGNCYRSLSANNINHPPSTSPTWWVLIPFPYVLCDAVWRGVYADALREDGQTQKAIQEEQLALAELQLSIHRNLGMRYDVLTDQQTGVPRNIIQPVSPAS